jgi:hypothetical protein
MDDIVTPGFSLEDFSLSNVDNINETVTNSINDINDINNSIVENSDYTIFIYIAIFFCVIILIIFVYNYYNNKKSVTFREDNNEHYNYS